MRSNRRYHNRKNKIIFQLLCLAAVVCTAVACYFFNAVNPDLVISYIDVGQGDAAYIRTPDNFRLLLDGGDEGSYDEVLEDFLLTNGVLKLDAAIVSHYHSDHACGILEALEDKFPIGRLYLPDTQNDSVLHGKLLDAAERNGTEVQYLSGGDIISLNDEIAFEVILPNPNIFQIDADNENNNSMLMKLTYGESGFLFTGDLETDAESALPPEINIQAEVLKVGHHGSHTSTSQEFLDRVSPNVAVIGVGANNRYGHPHKDVLKRLEEDIAHIYRTDTDGTITLHVKKNGNVNVKTSR